MDLGDREFEISTRVHSKDNDVRLPSESQFGCIPPASVRADFGSEEVTLRYDGKGYSGRIVLPPGSHSGYLTARITAHDDPVGSAFGFSNVPVSVPSSQWYFWVFFVLGVIAITYIFMHKPTRTP